MAYDPENDDDIEAADSDVADSSDAPDSSEDAAPAQSLPSALAGVKTSAAPPMNPVLQQYLQSKQDVADAQGEADRNSKISGLARAGAFMAAGLSGSNQAVNQQPFDQLDREAQAPVVNAQNEQKTAADDLSTQKQIADSDPNSPQSIAAKNMIKKLYPGKFDDKTLDGLSAADIGTSIMKPLELDQKIKESAAAAAERAATSRENARLRAEAQRKGFADKEDANADKAYTSMRKDLESFRGNTAAQQAAQKVQNADTALAIVKGKDPNSLTTQDLNMLADEMGKIATGGVPGEHGTQALMPNNLQTKYAEMKSFLLSKPTDAQAGEYIKHNMEYLDQMKSVAQGTLSTYRQNIAKGYKHRVREEDYNEAMQDYGMNNQPTASNDQAPGGDVHSRAASLLAARQAKKSQTSVASMVPNLAAPANAQGVPSSLQPNQPEGYAYGGVVGGLPSSNYSASVASRVPKPAAVHMPAPHRFDHGGQVSGTPKLPFESPANDVVNARLTPKEIVLPLHVTQAKDPAMAAYLYVKHTQGKGQ